MNTLHTLSSCLFVFAISISAHAASPYQDYLQQSPELKRPEAGYQIGSFAKFAPNGESMSKGFLTQSIDMQFDESRGPLMINLSPSYTPNQGMGPFGFGFAQDLSIHRFRLQGSIRFDESDQWSSPWGPLLAGNDGYHYPEGLSQHVRIKIADKKVTAYLDNRQTYSFEQVDASSGGTFAYFLTRITDHTNRTTLISYEKTAGGIWLPKSVRYGGRDPDTLPYSIEFMSESSGAVPASLSYETGDRRILDRRIQVVSFSSLGRYRYSYKFSYEPSDFGPGFHLTSMQKKFASGETDPAQVLTYRKTEADFGKMQAYKGLDALVAKYGRAFYQGDSVAIYDWNQDGLDDIEVAADRQVYLQTAEGFEEGLRYFDNGGICFPRSGTRNLARKVLPLFGHNKGLNVVSTERGTATSYRLTVCALDGSPIDSIGLPLNLEADSYLRWVDLNHDGRVDLVRFLGNTLRIFENLSTDGKLVFKELDPFPLPLTVQPKAIWFGDINGDGLIDFLVQGGSALSVHYGSGDFKFEVQADKYLVYRSNGSPFLLTDYGLDLIDLNGDGLADLSLTKGKERILFRNTGREFVQTALPIRSGLVNESESFSLSLGKDAVPHMLRLDGIGSAIKMSVGSRFSRFLESWDDGRGTLLSFEYGVSTGFPGQQSPYPYMKALVKRSVGMGERRTDFMVERPTLHSLTPMLLGFEKVSTSDKLARNTYGFIHTDDFAGILSESVSEDLKIPGLQNLVKNTYAVDSFQGLKWPRSDASVKMQKREGGTMIEQRKQGSYNGNLCARHEEKIYQKETLIKDVTYWIGGDDDLFMICLPSSVSLKGQHTRMDLNFAHRLELSREANGDLKQIEMVDPSDSKNRMFVQGIAYDGEKRPAVFEAIEGLKKTLKYEGNSDLLNSSTVSFGLEQRIASRDAYDQISAYAVNQNAASPWIYSFKRDGRERLSATWDSGFGSAERPLTTIAYQDPTLSRAGSLSFSQYQLRNNASHKWSDVYNAAGSKLAQFEEYGSTFLVKGVSRYVEADKLLETFPLQTSATESLESLDLLKAESRVQGSGFFDQFEARFEIDRDSTKIQQYDYLVNEYAEKVETTNGKFVRSWRSNSRGNIVSYTDEEKFTTDYTYDALGRLRNIALPDGKKHTVDLDVFGRTKKISRTEIGAVEYSYSGRSLVVEKRYFDVKGVLDRTSHHEYDVHGRKTADIYTKAVDTDTVRYFYDGRSLDGTIIPGQVGKLSQVQGLGFLKTWVYDAKGRLVRDEQAVNSRTGRLLRNLELTYDESDRLIARKIKLEDGSKNLSYKTETRFDPSGRQQEFLVDGRGVLSFGYNSLGLNETVSNPTFKLQIEFDSFTQDPAGFSFQGLEFGQEGISYHLELDDRGFASFETYEQNGGVSTRSYMYSPRGFLAQTSIGGVSYQYDYDTIGLMKSIEDRNGRRSLRHEPSLSQEVGGQKLVTDAMSRITAIADRSFKFGPRGVVTNSKSARGNSEYVLDETGQVLVTQSDSDEIHFGTDLYKSGQYLQPIMQGQQLIGWLENGAFKPAVSDFRGTPLLVKNIALSLDPFGAGENQGDSSASIHFAGHGFDEASGLVRMGVRQYDSGLGAFVSPDPLFLESPEECLRSPVECNLLSYAGNNPLTVVDTTGLYGNAPHRSIINATFPNLTDKQRDWIEAGSKYVDRFSQQFVHGTAPRHSMTEKGVDANEMARMREEFVKTKAEEAKSYFNKAEKARKDGDAKGSADYEKKAFFAVGEMLHPIQDSTSPSHDMHENNVGDGGDYWSFNPLEVIQHGPSWNPFSKEGSINEYQLYESVMRSGEALDKYLPGLEWDMEMVVPPSKVN